MKTVLLLLYVYVIWQRVRRNVNEGTLEHKKKRHWKLSLHQILQVVCFRGFMENFVDAESKVSSHLTKLFLARATARADL